MHIKPLDCAIQVEIDEYQNYDKALGALGEAYKCLSKAKQDDSMSQDDKLEALKQKMAPIKKFAMARRYESWNFLGFFWYLATLGLVEVHF